MKTISALGLVATLLLAVTEARAEGPGLAEKCRETGDHSTCAAAGAPLEGSSPETTLELYSAACAKHPDQCWALVAYGQRTLKKKDGPRAAQVLEKGCELRSARACSVLAAELEEGERGIPQDVARAARLHGQACELGNARSCVLLAVMTEDGRGVRRDARASQRLRTRAEMLDKVVPRPATAPAIIASDDTQCRKNQDALKCLSAGTALQDTDAVKAEELLRLGCTADKTTCGLWGFAIERLRRDDPGRGTRILDEGCASGASLACMVLADLNHSGFRAITRNETRAAELYDKACTLGEPAGCRATAARFRGVKDVGKADELRARASTLEAEADKPALALQEAWLKDAAQASAREPYVRELDRKRAEWRAMTSRARARWELRMQRLAAIDAGNEAPALPPAPATDAAESAARGGAIKRMAKVLFP
ncbi:MAG TPA: tetratricopeptide repeat protein [Labilithrix sp.]|nr:tetratricopeptide repeat protein [Labilithrix sp.]